DTTIRQDKPSLNDAAAAGCTMKGATKSRIRKECLVRWDLSQLPPTTRVGASCIRFKVADGAHGSFQAFEALRPWVDTDATWRRATSLDLWQARGARGAADADAAVVATTPARPVTGGVYEIALASALVQKWVSIPVANNGLVFGGNGGDGLTIVASEQADGPALVVGLP
ncbi:MAG: DNRLRE domain-containing protein, partial [Myxococcales bacterium]